MAGKKKKKAFLGRRSKVDFAAKSYILVSPPIFAGLTLECEQLLCRGSWLGETESGPETNSPKMQSSSRENLRCASFRDVGFRWGSVGVRLGIRDSEGSEPHWLDWVCVG